MSHNPSTAARFAEHYRTGKYADLLLVTSAGMQLGVHRLVVCSQSPILDAKAKPGVKVIQLDADDDTTVEQMVEWMYGIDDQELLLDRKTVDEVFALGPGFVCGEVLAMVALAALAAKYRVPKLEAQSLEMANLLIASLNSLQSVLEIALHLAPEGALGTVQRNLVSQAMGLIRIQQPGSPARPQKRLKKPESDLPIGTGQESPLSNINVFTPNREHAVITVPYQRDDSDSDTPLLNHYNENKRTNQQDRHNHRPTSTVSAPHPTPTHPKSLSQFTPINETSSTTLTTNTTTSSPRKRRFLTASLAISTALHPNSPPQGPHCLCHASSSDPTLVACTKCQKLYHPRCVGKGSFAKATYNLRDEVGYMLRDVETFEGSDGDGDGASEDGWGREEFKCGNCSKLGSLV